VKRERCDGFSLVELMVALVIGLILLGGVMQVFIGNRNSHRFQQALSELQDNARFGLEYLVRTARLAGYQGDSPGQWVLGPLTPSNGGPAITGIDNDVIAGNGILDGSDSVTVAFGGSADGFIKDCAGAAVAAGAVASSTFAVSETGELQCSTDGGTTWSTLVGGVQDMQIQYGLDTDGNQTANSYVTAGNVGADFESVVSMRVALLLRSTVGNLNLGVDDNAYTLLDKVVYAAGAAPADGRIRRVVSTTVKLRNRL